MKKKASALWAIVAKTLAKKYGPVSTAVQCIGLAAGVKAGFEVGTALGYLSACAALMFAGHVIDR